MRKMHEGRVQQPRLQYLTRSLIAGACLALAGTGSALAAAPTAFPTETVTVQLTKDGTTTPITGAALENTVVFDNNTYYLWYKGGASLSTFGLATSTDGINFTHQGYFTPTGTSPWWTQLTGLDRYPGSEPALGYVRLQKVGGDWIMAIWHTAVGGASDYLYSTSLWNLGDSPGNLNADQIGPLNDLSAVGARPKGPGGNHVGTFGIIRDADGNDTLYLRGDMREPASSPGGGLGRYELKGGVLASLPITLPEDAGTTPDVADLFTNTGFCWWRLTPERCAALDLNGDAPAFVDNYGRTLADGGTLHTYYSMDAQPPGRPGAKQLFHITSGDNGLSWTTAQGLFTPDGENVTVDGWLNTGNFSRPEVVPLAGTDYRSYFSTFNACGQQVMVTASAVPVPSPVMTIAKDFEPNVVAVDGESKLTVTVTAPPLPCEGDPEAPPPKFTSISYTDYLPEGVEMVSIAGEGDSDTCGGELRMLDDNSFKLSEFELAPGERCTTTVTVKPTRVGSFLNTIYKDPDAGDGGLDNDQGIPAAAHATDTLRTPGAPMAVAPIPTLGEVSLGLLGLLMAGWGARSLRRRRD